jgi:hypothetical protein
MIGALVRTCFLALALTVWQLFLQPLWNKWIEAQGHTVGFGETFLGYFIVIAAAWIISALATRRTVSQNKRMVGG